MKKLLFAAVIGGLFTVVSCSKSSSGGVGTYTCKCTVNGVSTSTQLTNVTQAEATTACNAGTNSASGVSCSLQ